MSWFRSRLFLRQKCDRRMLLCLLQKVFSGYRFVHSSSGKLQDSRLNLALCFALFSSSRSFTEKISCFRKVLSEHLSSDPPKCFFRMFLKMMQSLPKNYFGNCILLLIKREFLRRNDESGASEYSS